MSLKRPSCEKCSVEMRFDRAAPFADAGNAYAVAWKCPQCGEAHIIISSLGPLIPAPGMCLNCGAVGQTDLSRCAICGFLPTDALGTNERNKTDQALLTQASNDFWAGTCARGMYLVNVVLARNPSSATAWSIKKQALEQLGFPRLAMDAAREADRRLLPRSVLRRFWNRIRRPATP